MAVRQREIPFAGQPGSFSLREAYEQEDFLQANLRSVLIPEAVSRDSSRQRQSNGYRGSALKLALDADRTPVLLHDTMDDAQPQARAAADRLGGKERIEDL